MPERIGAYRLESPLGRGGMGEVFLAWDERLERPVAIKRIRQDAFLVGHHRERFRREARMAARLSHASIVQVHDLVMEESGDAIVMEYIEGPTLAERLARGPLGTAEAVRLAREIAEGLAAAHEAGLIHRDLKAENVVVTPSGHAKILDFGLARPVFWDGEMLTQQNALIGTCYAMSPEQARGGELDERSDLFSFGALLYEMLTGRSAFRAKNPLATLEKVLHDQPPPLAEARPDLPEDLIALVERLLAKDRDGRPKSAARVARKLERIERGLPAEEMTGPNDDSVSEMPTQAFAELPFKRSATAAPRSSPAVATHALPARLRRMALAGAFLAAITGASAYLIAERPTPPLRVLVARPELQPIQDERLALAASGVLSSALNSLGSLEGVSPLDPSVVAGAPASEQERARSAAADEILLSSLVWEGGMALVSLRRVDVEGGRVLWSDTCRVPTDPEGLRLLADRVHERVRKAFADFSPRPGGPQLEARNQDYAELLEIRGRVDQGTSDLEAELERLARIAHDSPRFLEAHILAAELGVIQFRSSREPEHLNRARTYAELALALAPEDPRTLRVEFKVALATRQPKRAEQILKQLDAQMPGDPEVLVLRARLQESQGRLDAAVATLRAAVDRAPSWRNVYWLSTLETDRGRIPEARRLLDGILKQAPANAWVQEQLAYLELVYGDLNRAEALYEALARANPRHPSYPISLGLIHYLRGHYRDAKTAYKQALDFNPGQIVALINQADAELALHNQEAAEVLYGAALGRLSDSQGGTLLTPEDELMKALCLARLGRAAEARKSARHAILRRPGDSQLLYQAALVNSLVGDLETALRQAKAARAGGVSPYWFAVPGFDALHDDPWMRALAGAEPQRPSR